MKMIRYLIVIAAMQFSVELSVAETLPRDLAELQSMREEKFAEINRIYISELKNLKIKYTKFGDLETAVKIAAIIEKVEGEMPLAKKELDEKIQLLIGSWGRKSHSSKYVINGDGTANHGSTQGKWSIKGDVLEVEWDNGYGMLIELGQKGREIDMKGYNPGRTEMNEYKIFKVK